MNQPAFPLAVEGSFTNMGLSMRDYFAAKAMVGVMTDRKEQQYWGEEYGIEDMIAFTAERAYEQADAMLKAREA